jgi:hypothetical protein
MLNNEAPMQEGKIFLGRSIEPEYLELKFANRHGLITGATGTGKTISLQVLAEGFSDAGVPVFAADIKGDLSGVTETGTASDNLVNRAKEVGLTEWSNTAYPAVFWDLFGEMGHPVRATVQEMGPLQLSRLPPPAVDGNPWWHGTSRNHLVNLVAQLAGFDHGDIDRLVPWLFFSFRPGSRCVRRAPHVAGKCSNPAAVAVMAAEHPG